MSILYGKGGPFGGVARFCLFLNF
ncbi:hypothetical protein EYZ11_012974 [Aspergillus tanneri]|uniref:Uncharacterized protein n=1 Tax=Aspergillus tanneri TaxID=1220188 RepID=A0A4S3IYV3_9EURO|nr:hypothetical protein EYZ11_012974 [Aspergillus tanneri]